MIKALEAVEAKLSSMILEPQGVLWTNTSDIVVVSVLEPRSRADCSGSLQLERGSSSACTKRTRTDQQQANFFATKAMLYEPEGSEDELQVSLRLAHFHAETTLAYYGSGVTGEKKPQQAQREPHALEVGATAGGAEQPIARPAAERAPIVDAAAGEAARSTAGAAGAENGSVVAAKRIAECAPPRGPIAVTVGARQ